MVLQYKKVGRLCGKFIIENSESYAREKGYEKVSRKSIAEQMEAMGMNLDEMLADM